MVRAMGRFIGTDRRLARAMHERIRYWVFWIGNGVAIGNTEPGFCNDGEHNIR